jgi:SAM-dependent methyltransferase
MKDHLVAFLICPRCLPEELGLTLDIHEGCGTEVVEGVLKCGQCRAEYPIAGGIALLHPRPQEPLAERNSRYESPEILSAYLWSHYADILGDQEATRAYSEWAEQFSSAEGIALDAGCAVGRFTFELSCKSDFAVGFDYSMSFIAAARKLLIERHLDLELKQEGCLFEKGTITLPAAWDGRKLDFIVADAQALPFRRHLFSSVASLNLVDKLPKPFHHLQEMNRTALKKGAQFLVSDPFSWSPDYAREEDWLGGSTHGIYAGRGFDNVAAILEGGSGAIRPPWTVQERGEVWWKIRNHRNHFELIRSCFVKASR